VVSEEFFQPNIEFFKRALTTFAYEQKFHPVLDYLEGLAWDGVPRLDTWLVTAAGAPDSSYVKAISSIMLIAAVRRVREPGCKYDEMVVWEGPQGGLKSSAAQTLCPRAEWFSDDLSLHLRSKELIEATVGKWIIEASDLAGKRRTEIEQLKAMLSRQVDGPARMAYGHYPVTRPRQFIFIGTTNADTYLADHTGARRFWPVRVKPFDLAWIRTHRDQLWAGRRRGARKTT
jgi:predicted P-loop ATPase